jgi:hypothetical protein
MNRRLQVFVYLAYAGRPCWLQPGIKAEVTWNVFAKSPNNDIIALTILIK